jgi:hypothetical protein
MRWSLDINIGGRGLLTMQLVYSTPEETTIKVTLDEGESLGNLSGPVEAFVPTDPDNADYAAILDEGLPVTAYEAPHG